MPENLEADAVPSWYGAVTIPSAGNITPPRFLEVRGNQPCQLADSILIPVNHDANQAVNIKGDLIVICVVG